MKDVFNSTDLKYIAEFPNEPVNVNVIRQPLAIGTRGWLSNSN